MTYFSLPRRDAYNTLGRPAEISVGLPGWYRFSDTADEVGSRDGMTRTVHFEFSLELAAYLILASQDSMFLPPIVSVSLEAAHRGIMSR